MSEAWLVIYKGRILAVSATEGHAWGTAQNLGLITAWFHPGGGGGAIVDGLEVVRIPHKGKVS
ncbi:MAG: hypothetical protein ACR2RF_26220 [Geminicoccaceae bacterium]